MSYQAEVINVLIASPSDVSKQRNEIEAAIVQWNKKYTDKLKVVLLPRRWEDDVYPARGKSDAQAIINEQLVEKCDILVGVFWNKLGTPTLRDKSGTLEEISICIENDKEVILYFVDDDVPRNVDRDELEKVDAYKAEYGKQNLYGTYDSSKIVDHLFKYVDDYLKKQAALKKVETISLPIPIPPSQVAPSQEGNSSLIDNLIIRGIFTSSEKLMISYILDTGTRHFLSKTTSTLEKIREWEINQLISNELSSNLTEVLLNFEERKLIEINDYVSNSILAIASYRMPLSTYDEIRGLQYHAKLSLLVNINSCKI